MAQLYDDDICYILEVSNDIRAVLSFLEGKYHSSIFYETDVYENCCTLRFRPKYSECIDELKEEFLFKDSIINIEDQTIRIIDFYETDNNVSSCNSDISDDESY